MCVEHADLWPTETTARWPRWYSKLFFLWLEVSNWTIWDLRSVIWHYDLLTLWPISRERSIVWTNIVVDCFLLLFFMIQRKKWNTAMCACNTVLFDQVLYSNPRIFDLQKFATILDLIWQTILILYLATPCVVILCKN